MVSVKKRGAIAVVVVDDGADGLAVKEHIFLPKLPITPSEKCRSILQEAGVAHSTVMHTMADDAPLSLDVICCYKGTFYVFTGSVAVLGNHDRDEMDLICEEAYLLDLDFSTIFN
jgi:hypothetical protein